MVIGKWWPIRNKVNHYFIKKNIIGIKKGEQLLGNYYHSYSSDLILDY
jgi:hypothetical protein